MVICIQMDGKTKDDLDQLVKVGGYHDCSHAIAIAIANQLLLDQNVGESGRSLVVSTAAKSASPTHTRQSVAANSDSVRPLVPAHIPSVFLLAAYPTGYEAAPLPMDVFAPGHDVPVDRWIFGQHNKLLPVKASCRALAALGAIDKKGTPIARAAADIASFAVELGDYLRKLDDDSSASRDEALSTAFPHSDAEAGDKTRLRYANQFVGSVNKHGQLSGLLVDLKLVNHTGGKESRIKLTDPGLNFAALKNPILDSEPKSEAQAKFSDEEMTFLLDHIRKSVPAEYSAFRAVLNALVEGSNSPERLDSALKKFMSRRSEKPFTDAFLTTQRSGAISRMADLDLIRRSREGVTVTYVPTEKGKEFLNQALRKQSA